MKKDVNPISRRKFLAVSGAIAGTTIVNPASTILASNMTGNSGNNRKTRLAIVGLGIRGTSMWGSSLQNEYGNLIEFVGLCDHNPGRLVLGKKLICEECRLL